MASSSMLFRSVWSQKIHMRISTNRLWETVSNKYKGLTKSMSWSHKESTKSRISIKFCIFQKHWKSSESMQDCSNLWCRTSIRIRLPKSTASSSILSKYPRLSKKFHRLLSSLISQESDLLKKNDISSIIPKGPSLAWSNANSLPFLAEYLTNLSIGEVNLRRISWANLLFWTTSWN